MCILQGQVTFENDDSGAKGGCCALACKGETGRRQEAKPAREQMKLISKGNLAKLMDFLVES